MEPVTASRRIAGQASATVPIEVVLFDLDDTLMAHTRAVDLAIERAQQIARQLASTEATVTEGSSGAGAVAAHPDAAGFAAFAAADAVQVRQLWRHLEEHHYARYLSGELDYLGQRIWRARDMLLPYGVELDDEAALRWFAEYLHGYRDNWTLFDDVLPALDALARTVPGVRFGIITNGDLDFQTDKLHRIALWERLDLTPLRADGSVDDPARRGRLIASGELGVTKPDAAIFAAAAAAFEVSTASCLYVGDRLATDALGAQGAGMRGVWLARPGRNETAVAADAALGGLGSEAARGGLGPEAARGGLGPEAARGGLGPEAARDGLGPEAARDGLGPEAAHDGPGPDGALGDVPRLHSLAELPALFA